MLFKNCLVCRPEYKNFFRYLYKLKQIFTSCFIAFAMPFGVCSPHRWGCGHIYKNINHMKIVRQLVKKSYCILVQVGKPWGHKWKVLKRRRVMGEQG